MNFSWGSALSDNLVKGYRFGKAIREDMAQQDYLDSTKATDAEEAEDKEAVEVVHQAKLDALNDPNSKYASMSSEDKKTAIAEMDALRDKGISQATRSSAVARKQALADYFARTGDIANADKTKEELRQAQWSQQWWDKADADPEAVNAQILQRYNNALAWTNPGMSIAKNNDGTYSMMQNGQAVGSPIALTNDMRNAMLRQLYTEDHDKEFGSAPTAADRTAFDSKMEKSIANAQNNRKMAIEEAKAKSSDEKNKAVIDYLKTKGEAAMIAAKNKGGKTGQDSSQYGTISKPDDNGYQTVTGADGLVKGQIVPGTNVMVPSGSSLDEQRAIQQKAAEYGVTYGFDSKLMDNVFVTSDGKKFDNQQKALAYQTSIKTPELANKYSAAMQRNLVKTSGYNAEEKKQEKEKKAKGVAAFKTAIGNANQDNGF